MSNHHVAVQNLQVEHEAIQAEITESLKSGKPTLELRRKLTEVGGRLQEARNAASASAAREQAEAVERAAAAGRVTAATAVAGIESSIGHLAAPAAHDPSTATMSPANETAIANAAANLALAESRYADAAQLHSNAVAEVTEAERKLADAQARHDLIVSDRREGRTSEAQEAKLYALSVDMADLRGMLEPLRATAATLPTNATLQVVTDARRAFDRATADARASLLADHVQLLTQKLENALYETEAAGRMVGKSLHLLWRPSHTLRAALANGALPARFQHGD